MSQRLESKVLIVTGATSGIGRAVSRRIASDGGRVVLAGRREREGEAAAGEINAEGGQAIFVAGDITSEETAFSLVNAAIERFGRLDGAFNNAGGIQGTDRSLEEVESESWDAEIAQNLTSVFYCMKAQIPALLKSGTGGSIVNNASIYGVAGSATVPCYAAAKHGVVGLTRSAALGFAGRGVRVNALVTGNVDTPLYRDLTEAPPDRARADLPAANPSQRVAAPEEIAAFVTFLLSGEATFITGAALAIDGGFTAG